MAKQDNKNQEDLKALETLTQMMAMGSASYSIFGSLFGGMTEPKEKYPYERLGNGFELRPLEMENNRHNYSHLYKDGKQVTSQIFRKGGLCHGFKDGYCSLILYKKVRKTKGNTSGFDSGNHVLINELGEIKMQSKDFDHPYHLGGNIARLNHTYYNLLTGEAIMPKSSVSIDGKNFIIVEHRYGFNSYTKEVNVPLGIYKIDKFTCEIEKIDDIK
jgi:hypothetical protein